MASRASRVAVGEEAPPKGVLAAGAFLAVLLRTSRNEWTLASLGVLMKSPALSSRSIWLVKLLALAAACYIAGSFSIAGQATGINTNRLAAGRYRVGRCAPVWPARLAGDLVNPGAARGSPTAREPCRRCCHAGYSAVKWSGRRGSVAVLILVFRTRRLAWPERRRPCHW
jgi:hypothetical protein